MQSFVELKNRLTSAPVLAYPRFDVNVPFILETDASAQGLGAVLSQTQSDGKVHPIAYASRSLNVHEKNYSATELETLGLVWASRLFRPYLLGHKCIVYTDHAACTSLLHGSHHSAKLARWALIIQELDLDIKHRPGRSNANADALSRVPVQCAQVEIDAECDSDGDLAYTSHVSLPELAKKQQEDPELASIFVYLQNGVLPENEVAARRLVLERSRYSIVDGILHYEHPDVPGVLRCAVPLCLREQLLKEAHGGKFAGHFAKRKIYKTLRKKYWWNGMHADVQKYCRACLECATRKGPGRGTRPPLNPIPIGGPFHRIGIDVLQLPLSFNGNQYALVMMDYFTPNGQRFLLYRISRPVLLPVCWWSR